MSELESSVAFASFPAEPRIPLTFGQILERIAGLLRSHYKNFIAVGLLPFGALIAFDGVFFAALAAAGAFRRPHAQPNTALMLWTFIPLSLLFLPVVFLTYGLYYGASSYVAVQIDRGLDVSAGEALRDAWSRAGRYVWLLILRGLIITVPMVVCMIAVIGGAAVMGLLQKGNQNTAALFFLVPLGILLYGAAIVYALVATLRLSLAFCACVHEDITARAALKRSAVLTAGAKGRIFLVLLAIYAIGYALFIAFYMVALVVLIIISTASAANLHDATPFAYAGLAVAGLFVLLAVCAWAILVMAAYTIAFAVIYRDQCLRIDPPAPVFPANEAVEG